MFYQLMYFTAKTTIHSIQGLPCTSSVIRWMPLSSDVSALSTTSSRGAPTKVISLGQELV